MKSVFVGVVGVLAAVLLMEGCGGDMGDGDETMAPVEKGTVAPVVISDDMVANLVICHGLKIPEKPGDNPANWGGPEYPADGEYKDLNPCGWPKYASVYFATEMSVNWYTQNAEGITDKTPGYEKKLVVIESAVGCASLCRDHDECEAYEWSDPDHFTSMEMTCGQTGDCAALSRRCILFAPADCAKTDGLGAGPILGADGKPLDKGKFFSGFKPDAEWKSELTSCPYGAKVEIKKGETGFATTSAP